MSDELTTTSAHTKKQKSMSLSYAILFDNSSLGVSNKNPAYYLQFACMLLNGERCFEFKIDGKSDSRESVDSINRRMVMAVVIITSVYINAAFSSVNIYSPLLIEFELVKIFCFFMSSSSR